jgi:uncharacterized short protein YbdD (DUF466 family)
MTGDAAPAIDRASRWRSLCSSCRQVFGLPDYDRYLAHAARAHPGQPVLSREAYCALAIERRYGGGAGPRCC